MADEKPTKRRAGELSGARVRRTARAPEQTSPEQRRLVDVDPWALLLGELLEVPEERARTEPARTKGK